MNGPNIVYENTKPVLANTIIVPALQLCLILAFRDESRDVVLEEKILQEARLYH